MGDETGSAPAANIGPVEDMMNALAAKHINTNFDIDTSPSVKSRASHLPQLVIVGDEADQLSYVVDGILENHECGKLLKQQAVLFRTSHHSGPLPIMEPRNPDRPPMVLDAPCITSNIHINKNLQMQAYSGEQNKPIETATFGYRTNDNE